jgi:hypothetical protein
MASTGASMDLLPRLRLFPAREPMDGGEASTSQDPTESATSAEFVTR